MRRPPKPPVLPAISGQVADPTIPISQEKWIGRVIVEFSKLEAALDDLIWNFLDLPMEYGRIITSRMDATAKVSTLRLLGMVAFDPMLQAYLKDILDAIDTLREHRNLIVHGTWGRSLPERTPIALSLRIRDTPSTVVSETFPPERMQAIWTAIQITKWRIISLFESALATRGTAHDRYPKR